MAWATKLTVYSMAATDSNNMDVSAKATISICCKISLNHTCQAPGSLVAGRVLLANAAEHHAQQSGFSGDGKGGQDEVGGLPNAPGPSLLLAFPHGVGPTVIHS